MYAQLQIQGAIGWTHRHTYIRHCFTSCIVYVQHNISFYYNYYSVWVFEGAGKCRNLPAICRQELGVATTTVPQQQCMILRMRSRVRFQDRYPKSAIGILLFRNFAVVSRSQAVTVLHLRVSKRKFSFGPAPDPLIVVTMNSQIGAC